MYIVSIDAIYYRYILAVPNLGNSILFNIKEENDQPEVIGSNYAAGNSTQLNRRLI
ncbi:MAG: hypothetical protein K0S67_1806 [Nitrososphaeraceae archaeon]|jgi:hypothetical protein|nr:hypothetical protein [Nitrososphaeraceae archaeon]MCD6037918.1 hypothetical protein [Nitrososphaeraceae archaeon]MDF2769095.1 hypothetical protein [Nitrososphaeraceae archaeon]